MNAWHAPVALILICTVCLAGCQLDPPARTVVEYRPFRTPATRQAPDSEVFVLWKWQPASTQASAQPIRQFPVEIQQVYAERGAPVGFNRSHAQLVAVAGATSIPLSEAHYAWRTLPGSSTRSENRRRRMDKILCGAGIVIGAVVIVVAVLLLVHENRHTLWDETFNSD